MPLRSGCAGCYSAQSCDVVPLSMLYGIALLRLGCFLGRGADEKSKIAFKYRLQKYMHMFQQQEEDK